MKMNQKKTQKHSPRVLQVTSGSHDEVAQDASAARVARSFPLCPQAPKAKASTKKIQERSWAKFVSILFPKVNSKLEVCKFERFHEISQVPTLLTLCSWAFWTLQVS